MCVCVCVSVPHLVISPPPPSRSAMSRPSSACVLTPPLVVMVTSLLPTSQVILRPPAKRNSAMGDLRGHMRSKSRTPQPLAILFKKTSALLSANHHANTLIKDQVNLLGRAEKLENTYRAIMSRQVSVSSRWTVFSPSSAWVTAFSSAEPRLQVVVEVCILQEENRENVKQQREGQRRNSEAHRLQIYLNM